MSEPYRIVVKVLSVDGSCDFGRQVDDEILFGGETSQGRVCLHALYSFLPRVFAIRHGAEFPWLDAEHKDAAAHACPDAYNAVALKIRRVREE